LLYVKSNTSACSFSPVPALGFGTRATTASKSAETGEKLQALVFDFTYSNHRGIIVHTRVMHGSVSAKDRLHFIAAGEEFIVGEVGAFMPDERPRETLSAGEIGYIVTGIKKPGVASVGDTLTLSKDQSEALPGYRQTKPVVWASIFPESQDDFTLLRQSLEKLRLSDSSLSYEEESSGTLGRGFRCGFLGMLHLEIVTERLKRESNVAIIATTPSITYDVTYRNGKSETIYSPALFPDSGQVLLTREPWVSVHLITPPAYVSALMQLLYDHEASIADSKTFRDGRVSLSLTMPLRELMRGFFDAVKSATSGYGSLSYEIGEMRDADVTRLDVLVAEELVPAFSRVISSRSVETEARKAAEKLKELLPRQLFTVKIQTRANGRIIASETLSALRKDVTGYLYGGDITRKMKLLEKQKRGKKKMLKNAKVNIPHDVFLKMVRD
jgi:GTP-binding protein LepA